MPIWPIFTPNISCLIASIQCPICSVYGIFTNSGPKNLPNVGKLYHTWSLWVYIPNNLTTNLFIAKYQPFRRWVVPSAACSGPRRRVGGCWATGPLDRLATFVSSRFQIPHQRDGTVV